MNAHNSIKAPQRQELWDGICDKGDRVAIHPADPLDDGSLSEGARLWYGQLCGWAKPDGSLLELKDGGEREIGWFAAKDNKGFPGARELHRRSKELERVGLLCRPRRGVLHVVRLPIEIEQARQANESTIKQRETRFTGTAKVTTRSPQTPMIDSSECPEGDQVDTLNGEKVTVWSHGSDQVVTHYKSTQESIQESTGRAANALEASDLNRARRLAPKHGIDADTCNEMVRLERQVRDRSGSEAVARIKHEIGESNIRALADAYDDLLVNLDEREAIEAEAVGELIADGPAVDGQDIPL